MYIVSWRHGDNGAGRFVRLDRIHRTCDAAVMFMLHGGYSMLCYGWGPG